MKQYDSNKVIGSVTHWRQVSDGRIFSEAQLRSFAQEFIPAWRVWRDAQEAAATLADFGFGGRGKADDFVDIALDALCDEEDRLVSVLGKVIEKHFAL